MRKRPAGTAANPRYPVIVQLALPFAPSAPTHDSGIAPTTVSRIAPTIVSPIAPTRDSGLAPATALAPTGDLYFVRHRRARRYLLRIDSDGRVRVTIPRGGSRREADEFVGRHLDWIARERSRITSSALSFEDRHAHRTRARGDLPARLLALAAQHGLTVTRVSIRNQRTRWGSCGRDGHISLNWRLVLMPPEVRDYVLIHELMHLRRLDHSRAYWRLVAAACPGYREARQWLRANGPALR
ncbi:MAG TPA: M48 family metallopeptidase [Vicinamibacterales bacterium]